MKTNYIPKQNAYVNYVGAWTGLVTGALVFEQAPSSLLGSTFGYFNGPRIQPPVVYSLANQTGVDAKVLSPGVDFQYNKRLDASLTEDPVDGFGNIDGGVYDSAASGSLTKPFRIIEGSKNITDPIGANLKIYARNLKDNTSPPPEGIAYVDPVNALFFLPGGADYWCKMESQANMLSPEIASGTPSFSGPSISGTTTGKWGNEVYWYYNTIDSYYFPFGSSYTPGSSDKYTISCWMGYGTGYKQIQHWYIYLGTNIYMYFLRDSYTDAFNQVFYTIALIINGSTVSSSSYNLNTLSHVYIVVDYTGGLSGGKTCRVFINGVEYLSSTAVPGASGSGSFCFRVYQAHDYWEQGTRHSQNGYSYLENLKIWKSIFSENPAAEYNGGAGIEEALSSYPYGSFKLSYHYLPAATQPVKLNEPSTGNTQIQLEDAYDLNGGVGYFGIARLISREDYSNLVEGIDFTYDNPLINYDVEDSGPLGAPGGIFRVVVNNVNVAKEAGMNLDPIAKELPLAEYYNVPQDEVWIDPLRAKFALPGIPSYWSKCETVYNLTSPDIIDPSYIPAYSGTALLTTVGKFNSGIKLDAQAEGANVDFLFDPFGAVNENWEKGTISLWLKEEGNDTFVDFYSEFRLGSNFKIRIGMDKILHNYYLQVFINGSSVFTKIYYADQWNFWFIVWNNDRKLAGENTLRVYLNGNILYSTNIIINTLDSVYPRLYMKAEKWDWRYGKVYLDNIKLWRQHFENAEEEYNEGTGTEDFMGVFAKSNVKVGYFKPRRATGYLNWSI